MQTEPKVYRYESRRTGYARETDLWLMPEIRYESCLRDYDDYTGEEQFWHLVGEIRDRYPDEYERNAIPIYWTVMPAYEAAPFMTTDTYHRPFLNSFTWPTDEDGDTVDWFTIEVRHDRHPAFSEFLGWKPSPLQESCPLKSIVDSKLGLWKVRDTGDES